MLVDWFSVWHLFIRWFHVAAAAFWTGSLFFLCFTDPLGWQGASGSDPDAMGAGRARKALWWLRWSAMVTFLAGIALFSLVYMYEPGYGWGPSVAFSDVDGLTARGRWISWGMLLGIVMWLNVWFGAWPAAKRLLAGGLPEAESAALKRRARRFSILNAYLSGPVLVTMLAPGHFGYFSWPIALIAAAISLLAVFKALRIAPRVGREN